MVSTRPAPRLRGRTGECAALDRLLSGVRAAESQVLVLHGEAGVGKSALLEYILGRAGDLAVARAAGVESEMELAYAGLHQLCAPLLRHLDRLPDPQRDALSTAFGRSAGPPPDRFLVGLGVLSLLSVAAEAQPLLCVVDDAQWLDRVSAQVLAFVARRLLAEPVGLVFAVRDDVPAELGGLPDLAVAGLGDRDARALLDSVLHGRLDERVRSRIIAEARGNPLALLELPHDPAAAEGGFGRPDTRPPAGYVEESYLRRVQSLPPATQRLLLTAAAEPLGDTTLLVRAADRLGISSELTTPAEEAGLIEIGTRVRFRHPLIRSAAYRAADVHERRRVHRALAEATDPESDPDRRAWHGANAAAGPDDVVADELEHSADRARARGGIAAAGAFLERSAELTSDPARRAARALAAADAKIVTAALDAARGLLALAESGPLSDLERAEAARLHAQLVFAESRGGGPEAPTVSVAAIELLDAARGLDGLDDALARETYLDALGAAMYAGRDCPRGGVVEVAEPAALASPSPDPGPTDLLLDGMAAVVTRGPATGYPRLREALGRTVEATSRHGDDMNWFWRAFPIVQESAGGELWDDEILDTLATYAVRLARETGALSMLPRSLSYLAGCRVLSGDLDAAAAMIEEAATVTAATGISPLRYHAVSVAAWRGHETEARELIAAAARHGSARGEGRIAGMTGYLSAVLDNGLGRHDEALTAARRACEHVDLGFFGWCLVELVEAAALSGDRASATRALAELTERTEAAGTDWALGQLARSRALVADVDADAEEHFREAIDRLGRTRIAVHLARAHLVFGEWLRRHDRPREARRQLHTAHEMFERMGAEAFADRASRALRHVGDSTARHTAQNGQELTAQESQIATLAGAGLTNPEIGAQLFISPHTVEWHLRKVFAKLGISSRRQLQA